MGSLNMGSYHGLYRSSTSGTTGCIKQFLTASSHQPSFPPMVQYECDLCHTVHGFRLTSTQMASTPTQRANLRRNCAAQGIELDVELT